MHKKLRKSIDHYVSSGATPQKLFYPWGTAFWGWGMVGFQQYTNPPSHAISHAWEISCAVSRQLPMNNNTAAISSPRRVHWGGNASMHQPQTFGESCPPSSPFPCAHPWSSIFSRLLFVFHGWQWVFLAILLGKWFYSLHKSKDTIKATHPRAIKGTNNSMLLWRGCHWMRTVSAAANAGEKLLVPLWTLRGKVFPAATPREMGQTKYMVFCGGLLWCLIRFPLFLT